MPTLSEVRITGKRLVRAASPEGVVFLLLPLRDARVCVLGVMSEQVERRLARRVRRTPSLSAALTGRRRWARGYRGRPAIPGNSSLMRLEPGRGKARRACETTSCWLGASSGRPMSREGRRPLPAWMHAGRQVNVVQCNRLIAGRRGDRDAVWPLLELLGVWRT